MSALRAVGHEDRMSIVEHLDELRSRLIVCVIAFLACFCLTYWQNDEILELINSPLEQSQNLSCERTSKDPLEQSACFQKRSGEAFQALEASQVAQSTALRAVAGDDGVAESTARALTAAAQTAARAADAARAAANATPSSQERQPVTLGVAEPFTTTFTVAGYAALLLCLPVLLWQAYAFVLPAFTREERKAALPMMAMVPFLFIAGVVFAYFVALPRAVDFLQNFNDDNFDILIQAKDYYKFSIMFMGAVGLMFQIPVGTLIVTRLGVVTVPQLRKNRGYVMIALAVLAAIATPTPDPITMLVALLPLMFLFELSILLAALVERRSGPGRDRWKMGEWWDEEDEDEDEDGDDDDEDDDPDSDGDDDLDEDLDDDADEPAGDGSQTGERLR